METTQHTFKKPLYQEKFNRELKKYPRTDKSENATQ